MKTLDNIRHFYFLGIGGIGMSALARYFNTSGKTVAGYDRTPTLLTQQIADEGISVHFDDSPGLIPVAFRSPGDTCVIYTPAVPADHAEMAYFRENGFTLYKRSEILGLITRNYKTVAVAGTHGKTTVSTMIAHIMAQSDMGCNAFLGGISKNFNNNLVLNSKSDWVVTEADEFDRSFLQLFPYAGIVTAMDPDHLDIYGTADAMRDAFNRFIGQISRDGILMVKPDLPIDRSTAPDRTYTYSLNEKSDFRASNIRLVNQKYYFDLAGPDILVSNLSIDHPGLVNVENAIAASAMTYLLKIDPLQIRLALATFTGIQRRFDYQVRTDKTVFVDDYAHHPKEIEATLKSLRELYPGRKITGVFQPHLFSRTQDFAGDFAKSLNLLDRLILLDIYPARELPIEGVTSDLIFRNVHIPEKVMCTKEQLLDLLSESKADVLITLGAGDIANYVDPIKQLLLKQEKPA